MVWEIVAFIWAIFLFLALIRWDIIKRDAAVRETQQEITDADWAWNALDNIK